MKNDYNRNSFWVIKGYDGSSAFYIRVNGSLVSVPEDVYKVCKNSYMKIRYENKRDTNRVVSLDKVDNFGHSMLDCLKARSEENDRLTIEILKEQMTVMDEPLRSILIKYFFEDKTIREISKELDMPKSTVSDRLIKGKKVLKEFIHNINKF